MLNQNVYLKSLTPGAQFYYCGRPYVFSGHGTYGDIEARPMERRGSKWAVLDQVESIRGTAIVRTFT